MSELTRCNFCSLADIKRRAKQDGMRIVSLAAVRKDKYFLGGTDVFRFPASLMTKNQFMRLTHEEQQRWWICWQWEISDHCVC
jgi:hypothetical protein